MKLFLVTFLACCLVVASFIYFVDPAYRWHRVPEPFTRQLQTGEIKLSPGNYDERKMKMSHINFIDKPDVLIMGSSRSGQISSAMFNKNIKIFNASVSGTTFEDYIGFWQSLKSQSKLPHYVIIFADPWHFNSAANHLLSAWRSLKNPVDAFYKEYGLTTFSGMVLWPDSSSRLDKRISFMFQDLKHAKNQIAEKFSQLMEVLSYKMLRAAYSEWSKSKFSLTLPQNNNIIQVAQLSEDQEGELSDGSTVYPAKNLKEKSPSELRALIEKESSESNYVFDGWKFDEDALKKLELLISDIQKSGSMLLLISPPLHPWYIEMAAKKSDIPQYLSEAEKAYRELPEVKSGSVSLCEIALPSDIGCRDTEFADCTHMLKSCVRNVMNYCLGRSKQWQPLVAESK